LIRKAPYSSEITTFRLFCRGGRAAEISNEKVMIRHPAERGRVKKTPKRPSERLGYEPIRSSIL
jgi:hypothetical protein